MFTEIQSNKIYLPLLQQFVNVLADEIMDYNKNTLDDTSAEATTTLSNFVINDSASSKNYKNRILFKTMAAAIRSIVTNKKSVSSANILHFAEDNLINVPDYMKDKMMAYLPIFNKHLNIISTQAKFIKVTLESSSLKMITNKGDYINSFDKIIKGCYALQGCINSVSNELADIPLYFETYKNSISDYKNRNGHLPFMPLSHTSHLLNNHIRLTEDVDNKINVNMGTKVVQHAIMIGGKNGGYRGGTGPADKLDFATLSTNSMYQLLHLLHTNYNYAKDNYEYTMKVRYELATNIDAMIDITYKNINNKARQAKIEKLSALADTFNKFSEEISEIKSLLSTNTTKYNTIVKPTSPIPDFSFAEYKKFSVEKGSNDPNTLIAIDNNEKFPKILDKEPYIYENINNIIFAIRSKSADTYDLYGAEEELIKLNVNEWVNIIQMFGAFSDNVEPIPMPATPIAGLDNSSNNDITNKCFNRFAAYLIIIYHKTYDNYFFTTADDRDAIFTKVFTTTPPLSLDTDVVTVMTRFENEIKTLVIDKLINYVALVKGRTIDNIDGLIATANLRNDVKLLVTITDKLHELRIKEFQTEAELVMSSINYDNTEYNKLYTEYTNAAVGSVKKNILKTEYVNQKGVLDRRVSDFLIVGINATNIPDTNEYKTKLLQLKAKVTDDKPIDKYITDPTASTGTGTVVTTGQQKIDILEYLNTNSVTVRKLAGEITNIINTIDTFTFETAPSYVVIYSYIKKISKYDSLTGMTAPGIAGINLSIFNTLTINKFKRDATTKIQYVTDSINKYILDKDPYRLFDIRLKVDKQSTSDLKESILETIPSWQEIYKSIFDFNSKRIANLKPTKQTDLGVSIQAESPAVTPTSLDYKVKENDKLKYNLNIGLLPMPKISNGSESFIYAYGTRGLFSDNIEPNIKLAPGVNNTVDIFNSKPQAVTGGNMDPKLVNDSFVASVHLMRYCTDYIYHKTFLMDNDMDKTTLHYIVARSVDTRNKLYYNVLENLSCQTARSRARRDTADNTKYDLTEDGGIRKADDEFFLKTYNIIMLINNDNYKESLYRMMKCLTNNDKDGFSDTITDREKMRVYNILDTNIVPINFHALQRELPYSNIFNYSYTFDELVKEKFGVIYNSYNEGKMRNGSNIYDPYTTTTSADRESWKFKFAEDQLVDILINPYKKRDPSNYHNTIYKLMIGADGISSGRPKYLSDQLWNKVLLNTIYKNDNRLVNTDSVTYKNTKNTLSGQIDVRDVGQKPAYLLYLPDREVNKKGYSEPATANITMFTGRASERGAPTDIAVRRGQERYNTYLIRSIEWFVHLQRCMRTLMKDHLEWVDDAVVTKSNSVASSITEYKNDNVFDPDDF